MHDTTLPEKLSWATGAAVLVLTVSILIGASTPLPHPTGRVDTAYKMNRFTGNVWLVKTYVKQVGQLRVPAAREATVEVTQEMSGDANVPSVATR